MTNDDSFVNIPIRLEAMEGGKDSPGTGLL